MQACKQACQTEEEEGAAGGRRGTIPYCNIPYHTQAEPHHETLYHTQAEPYQYRIAIKYHTQAEHTNTALQYHTVLKLGHVPRIDAAAGVTYRGGLASINQYQGCFSKVASVYQRSNNQYRGLVVGSCCVQVQQVHRGLAQQACVDMVNACRVLWRT